MSLPDFVMNFPALDVPFDPDVVRTRAIRSDSGLVVFFEILKDTELAPHSHKAQWGTVINGEIELTIDGKTRTYRTGDSYDIPSGAEHGARIKAGSVLMDVFEEPDRYPIRREASG